MTNIPTGRKHAPLFILFHTLSTAYIAALQRTIASRSDCLLLFGRGNFQEVALSAYLRNHPNKVTRCVHIVCASRSLRKNILETL